MKRYLFLILLVFADVHGAPRDSIDVNPLFAEPVPGHQLTIMGVMERAGNFKQMYALFDELKLDAVLAKNNLLGNDGGKFTVFLPTDDALIRFGKLGLLRTDDAIRKGYLEKFVKYHIVTGVVSQRKLKDGPRRYLETLSKTNLYINSLPIPVYSFEAINGVAHVIDKVLINPEVKKAIPELNKLSK